MKKGRRSVGISFLTLASPPCLPSPSPGLSLVLETLLRCLVACLGMKDQRPLWKVSVQTSPLGPLCRPRGGDLPISWEQPCVGLTGVSPGPILPVRPPLVSRGLGSMWMSTAVSSGVWGIWGSLFPMRLLCPPCSHHGTCCLCPPSLQNRSHSLLGGRSTPLDARAWEFIGVTEAGSSFHSQLCPHLVLSTRWPQAPSGRPCSRSRRSPVPPTRYRSLRTPSLTTSVPFSLLCGLMPFHSLAAC